MLVAGFYADMESAGSSNWLKRKVIGTPISSSEDLHQRLPKKVALPVFASDAISSTAYASEEILIVLISFAAVGAAAYSALVPISMLVMVLLAIVVNSYRQTIYAYPGGGGAYIVSRENLGRYPSLVAGGSMLTDYILTVAVSVSGGTAAIISAFNGLAPYRVQLAVGFVIVITLANLRGLRESGALFAPPTYLYVLSLISLIVIGLYRVYFQDLGPIEHDPEIARELLTGTNTITLFFFLKAFSSGAVALTGVEAVADGVPAFKKPEPKNAATVLVIMACILGFSFFGLSLLTQKLKPLADEEGLIKDTVLAQLAEHVYGGRNVFFFITQFATFGILVLAANTAYADFPRLSSIIARDNFLPRQFMNRGDRLVFSNGILFLSVAAIALVIAFSGKVTLLIPLYAVGVFTGFTLSQTGMLVHSWRLKEKGWQRRVVISGIGASTTAFVAGIVVVVKFTDGAWIPAALIPALVLLFTSINKHYVRVRSYLQPAEEFVAPFHTHFVIVLVGTVNRGVLQAIQYAESLRPDRLIALSVINSEDERRRVYEEWEKYGLTCELQTVYSEYRELTEPILNRIDELDRESTDDLITVVIPEFVTSLSTQWLHNQSALQLKARLLYRPNTVVTSVPVVIP
jgi:amino acid transporter